jgi:predicted RNase H-like HicB family nuclease
VATEDPAGSTTTAPLPEWLTIAFDREEDGRWIAMVPELPGVMAYGKDREDALAKVTELARKVLVER